MTIAKQWMLPLGERFGSLQIRRVLGMGAFSVTYEAIDQSVGDIAVVKEYYPRQFARRSNDGCSIEALPGHAPAYRAGLESFIVKARALTTFHHASIVGVSQLMEANNTAYMVTDYEGGRTLESVLDEDKHLAMRRVSELGRCLAAGLRDLHNANIEHRDVTPRNIIMRDDGSTVLIDFGAAWAPGSVDVDANPHKRQMRVYAAPEQMTDRYLPGPRTDLYGLGAVLYRCISGKPPPSADKRMQFADSRHRLREVDIAMAKADHPRLEALMETTRWMLELAPERRPDRAQTVLNAMALSSRDQVKALISEQLKYTLMRRQPKKAAAKSRVALARAPFPLVEHGDAPLAPSQPPTHDVVSLLQRRLDRFLSPGRAKYFAQTATKIFGETELLDCLAALRPGDAVRDRALGATLPNASGTPDARHAVEWLRGVARAGSLRASTFDELGR